MASIGERPSKIRVMQKPTAFGVARTFLENRGMIKPRNVIPVETFRAKRVEKLKNDFREEVEHIMGTEEGPIRFPVLKPRANLLGKRWGHYIHLKGISEGHLSKGEDHILFDITDSTDNPTYKITFKLNADNTLEFSEQASKGKKQESKLHNKTAEEEQQMEFLFTLWEHADIFLESELFQTE